MIFVTIQAVFIGKKNCQSQNDLYIVKKTKEVASVGIWMLHIYISLGKVIFKYLNILK